MKRYPWKAEFREGCAKGFETVQQNFIPALFLQGVLALFLWSYYEWPRAREAINDLGVLRKEGGLTFAFFSLGLSVAIFSEGVVYCFHQNRPSLRDWVRRFIFVFLVYGIWGVVMQSYVLVASGIAGYGTDLKTVLIKVLIDRTYWALIMSAPYQIFFQIFQKEGYSFSKTLRRFKNQHEIIAKFFIPYVIINQTFWLVAVFLTYSFPVSLQYLLLVFSSSLWVLLLKTNVEISHQRRLKAIADLG